jgi:hypothetical protein
MALNFTGHKAHSEREYIPEAFGNRESTTPARVWISVPTERDKREIEAGGKAWRFKTDARGMPVMGADGSPQVEIDAGEITRRHHKAVEMCVVRVENYSTPDGEIKTGADLSTHGKTEILTEVYKEIMSGMELSVDESKKSDGSPSSCSAATPALDGTASGASKGKKILQGTAREAK